MVRAGKESGMAHRQRGRLRRESKSDRRLVVYQCIDNGAAAVKRGQRGSLALRARRGWGTTGKQLRRTGDLNSRGRRSVMRSLGWMALAACLVVVGPVRADDQAEGRKIVDRAL